MKIKFKLRPTQYAAFVYGVAQIVVYASKENILKDVDIINAKDFYFDGITKINRSNANGSMRSMKEKSFAIDMNHYEALKRIMQIAEYKFHHSYVKSILLFIKQSAEPQILSESTNVKWIEIGEAI